jgi:hypothetical protein
MDRLRQTDRDRVARLQTSSGTYSFPPPSPKKFLHSFLGCLKSSWSRFKSFYFFRKKLRSLEGFDQMSAFWSMFWFKPFRNFLRKNCDISKIRSLVGNTVDVGWPTIKSGCLPTTGSSHRSRVEWCACGFAKDMKQGSVADPVPESVSGTKRAKMF